MIVNGDFARGLRGWSPVSGSAFDDQPTPVASINARDVLIDGNPIVGLGGDFWHLPYPIGQVDGHLIRSVHAGPGVLDSDIFTISLENVAFRLGGQSSSAAYVELRIPEADADPAGAFPPQDAPDQDRFVAVQRAEPTGSDIMSQISWPVRELIGIRAKIRLGIDGTDGDRLLVGGVQLVDVAPEPLHQPVWGWADLHCHPMAQAGFGGLLAGHMHGPVEDLGSCVTDHGLNHQSFPFHLVSKFIENRDRANDGSRTTPGWTTGMPKPGAELGFAGWPAFDDLTHIKVHQTWIKRAYDGGQRLMVALIVHSELLASLAVAPQSDRDTVEPQIQMLKEFVAHNGAWCGIAKTPVEARTLIEANKLAFVLGLETDSINGWIDPLAFPQDDGIGTDSAARAEAAIHAKLHAYFAYLKDLGVVQVNLLHLSDNAFGGMAVYDLHFLLNSLARTKKLPKAIPAVLAQPVPGSTVAVDDDDINCRVTVASALWKAIADSVPGFAQPLVTATSAFPPPGDVNALGLSLAGKGAVLEAMRLGMVIDLDHMSELSAIDAHDVATGQATGPYPLVSAHNGARRMAPRPLEPTWPSMPAPRSDRRASEHVWPNENMKSNVQLGFIASTGGMFGHGTAASDSRSWGDKVANDCPGSDKTFAQGFQYVHEQLGVDIGFGTDWNSLLAGPGPRFGTQAASGLVGEVEARDDDTWRDEVRRERRDDASRQTAGVAYSLATPLIDWQSHRFASTGLYDGLGLAEGDVERMWQAMAVLEAKVDLMPATVQTGKPGEVTLASGEQIDIRIVDMLHGMTQPATWANDYERAGMLMNDDVTPRVPVPGLIDNQTTLTLVDWLRQVRDRWSAMRSGTNKPLTRSMAGPHRDFDFNLDGLAHYGMLPDMLQDLKNVGFPPAQMISLFSSAERYLQVWQRSVDVGAALPH